MRDELKLKISLLPTSPGVYQYLNREGTVIYVGKAKNLKRRVSSYFNRVHPVVRTNLLVRNIWDMKYIVVNTEEEALDLENSLIKEYQPRYNVLLKDDKSYPWICVTKELFPRVFITREKHTKGAKYFGPYPKTEVAHALVDTIKQLYPIRTCRHPLTAENVENRKYKLCLQYHIKNCEGCCQGFVSHETYANYIDNITWIGRISGSDSPIMIVIRNAVNLNGFSMQAQDKNEGQPALMGLFAVQHHTRFHAHQLRCCSHARRHHPLQPLRY